MDPYVGEIRMFGGNFAPDGWALCNGQTLSIADYSELYSLIGTTYGGDGVTNFALPDLRSRIPIHKGNFEGNVYQIGQKVGAEMVTLNVQQIPAHTHALQAGVNGEYNAPAGHVWASWPGRQYTDASTGLQPLSGGALSVSGGGQPHNNMPPFLVVNFIIALEGIYPGRS